MTLHRRNNFTSPTKRAAYARSGGICECHRIPHVFPIACGRPLGEGNTRYEHIDPDKISGRNDLDNCAALTKTCQRYKTRAYDLPTIADNNRMQDRARGIRPIPKQALPFGRNDFRKKKMDGTTVNRSTGAKLSGRPWVRQI